MKVYKLTNADDQTHGGCQWGEGVTHETDGSGDLCGPGWLHAYSDPLFAVLHNPIHGNFDLTTAHLWECEAEGEIRDDREMKLGCTRLTTIRRVKMPVVTIEQRIEYGIRCALHVCDYPAWVEWAEKWLSGKDRSEASAEASAWAASAAELAADAASQAAARAAARAASAEASAWAAAWASQAAAEAAEADDKIDLAAIARRCVEGE